MTTYPLLAPPQPGFRTGMITLRSLIDKRSLLAALSKMHQELGNQFRISLPGFNPYVLVGPEANRFILVQGREDFLWRNETDPVARLFNQGLLVLDGAEHDQMRTLMSPPLHRQMLSNYSQVKVDTTDEVLEDWLKEPRRDLLVDMRKIALIILMRTLFQEDYSHRYDNLLPGVLDSLDYISPGLWLVLPFLRKRYSAEIRKLDEFLLEMIRRRRRERNPGDDLLSILVSTEGLSVETIRDQLITMLIAGHDTSTSLLSWALYLIAGHSQFYGTVQDEIDGVLGSRTPDLPAMGELENLDLAIRETMRLYPPIHLGARKAAVDVQFNNYWIPADSRVMYSIYLTHRMERYWPQPDRFVPTRFKSDAFRNLPPYTYLPFGGGPRNCIGYAFAQLEAKVVMARILQRFDIHLSQQAPRVHMGASLEPRPGVFVKVTPRSG